MCKIVKEEQLLRPYLETTDLSSEIRSGKYKAWQELLVEFSRHQCGHLCVLGRLHTSAPILDETLYWEFMYGIMDSLFPWAQGVGHNRKWSVDFESNPPYLATDEEMHGIL